MNARNDLPFRGSHTPVQEGYEIDIAKFFVVLPQRNRAYKIYTGDQTGKPSL
jgi:hypothetical protein